MEGKGRLVVYQGPIESSSGLFLTVPKGVPLNSSSALRTESNCLLDRNLGTSTPCHGGAL